MSIGIGCCERCQGRRLHPAWAWWPSWPSAGLKVDYRSVWEFVHAEKLSFKKRRWSPASAIVLTSRAGARNGQSIRAGSILRAWSSSTRPGPRPTWRRCGDGRRAAKAHSQGAARPLEDHDLPGRAAPRPDRRTMASSTARSTARASGSMSRRFSSRPCSPATSSSWTISAATRARPCVEPSAPPAPSCSSCPNTRPT